MKKVLLACLLLLLCSAAAQAEFARDVTSECKFQMPFVLTKLSYMRDRDYQTTMETDSVVEPVLNITTGETPVAGMYVEFGRTRLPFSVQVKEGGKWRTVANSGGYYAQEYVAFPPVTGQLRVCFRTNGKAQSVRISEITMLSEGAIDPEKIHIWMDTVQKADLMITVAHPDDELLWLGGCIPYYTKEKNMAVLVNYLTCGKSWREHELLNGLWHCGVRHYPQIAYLPDFKPYNTDGVYANWDRYDLYYYMVKTIRQYRPEVIVTHDLKGEYGHAQHIACAYSMQHAVSYAADEDFHRESAQEYGTWDVKKFYVHLGEDYTTVMDWNQPLETFDGKTGLDIAKEAFEMHVSQASKGTYAVAGPGTAYDSTRYTLIHTLVGRDVYGNNLFENIRPEDLTTRYFKFE